MSERAMRFDCEGAPLVGVLHEAPGRQVGVVVVVGGPQYRVGSHRQFVLLARALAAAGYPVLRFDVRGMGDSGGEPRTFEHIEPDIRAAVDCVIREVPALKSVVLWGLCDGASASLMYAPGDARVRGLVLLNPWVRSEAGIAETYLKHYYGKRLLSGEFWRSLLSGRSRIGVMLRELLRNLRLAAKAGSKEQPAADFTERMGRAAKAFDGVMLLILSGNDLTAREFESHCARSASWQRVLGRSTTGRQRLDEADHTFSRARWRDAVADWTRSWLDAHFPP